MRFMFLFHVWDWTFAIRYTYVLLQSHAPRSLDVAPQIVQFLCLLFSRIKFIIFWANPLFLPPYFCHIPQLDWTQRVSELDCDKKRSRQLTQRGQ